jgi:hypothetical protein
MNQFTARNIIVSFLLVAALIATSGCHKDELQELRTKANDGDSQSQFDLARRYYKADGIERNTDEAITWFRKAAAQGNSKAFDQLGGIYESGFWGVPKDIAEADRCYRKAAELELQKAEAGDPEAQVDLAKRLRGSRFSKSELGIKTDINESLKWLQAAAKNKYIPALIDLGYLYSNGNHLPKNYEESSKWFRLATEEWHKHALLGEVNAFYALGSIYYDGQPGVPQNRVEAYAWLKMALAHDNDPSYITLDRIKSMEREFSIGDLQKALQRLNELQSQIKVVK